MKEEAQHRGVASAMVWAWPRAENLKKKVIIQLVYNDTINKNLNVMGVASEEVTQMAEDGKW